MKIFVDGYLLNKEHQGTKTYIKELYKEFAKQNPDFLIYIACFKDNVLENEFKDFLNIKFLYFKNTKRVFRMLFEIPKIIAKYNFDYAHFQYVLPFSRTKKCKYIVTIHDILFNDFKEYFSNFYQIKRNFLFKYSAKTADILLTVSSYSKERICKLYKVKEEKVFITPNGVNNAFLEIYNKKTAIDYIYKKYKVNNYILYVSRIEPRKNQQLLLKVLPQLEQQDVKLVFIGFKTIANKILDKEYKALPSKLKKNVFFFDKISDQDLIEFYKAAKLFVYPTFAEGFGIPPLEAAALKIPVICSNSTAMQDFSFFKPYLINVNNTALLVEKISEVLIDTNQKHLEQVQTEIRKHYTWVEVSRTFLRILEENK
ncbi:glycosyltransferase family 1 protein [uncultured Polaribacter sp.]|uniref:glycosyltransferase family 4 protein n=1 Tax=uncultured Polaribacter sp. TaxID=174711 RepID=UPI00262C6D0C|nr:glycosyltransferase family 1 protein [uncultured Polaribacter sp.]